MLIEIKAGQFRKVSRLVRRECCNCMDGNCLLLDDGETHTCVQLISKYHIFCTATSAPNESSGRRQPNASVVSVNDRSSSYI